MRTVTFSNAILVKYGRSVYFALLQQFVPGRLDSELSPMSTLLSVRRVICSEKLLSLPARNLLHLTLVNFPIFSVNREMNWIVYRSVFDRFAILLQFERESRRFAYNAWYIRIRNRQRRTGDHFTTSIPTPATLLTYAQSLPLWGQFPAGAPFGPFRSIDFFILVFNFGDFSCGMRANIFGRVWKIGSGFLGFCTNAKSRIWWW